MRSMCSAGVPPATVTSLRVRCRQDAGATGEEGWALLTILFFSALLAVSLGSVLPRAAMEARREREAARPASRRRSAAHPRLLSKVQAGSVHAELPGGVAPFVVRSFECL